MPAGINESFVRTIGSLTEMDVKLAVDGQLIEDGKVYIAPSNLHMVLLKNAWIELHSKEMVNYVRPSIDVMMCSIVRWPSRMTVGIVLTGMGVDGANGISHIKGLGGVTIAQDEQSCVIYGMPEAAARTGDVDFTLEPRAIRRKLIDMFGAVSPMTV
jgi:two-component system chemotaxis response regulator CheB